MEEQQSAKKEGFLEEKQERREFLKNLGKKALPVIAFLGLGTFGGKLHGIQNMKGFKATQPKGCMGGCAVKCQGACSLECGKKCEGTCDSTCTGDCSKTCKDDCDNTSKNDSDKTCLDGNAVTCRSETIK